MKACTDAPLLLTSTTVQPSPDGTYTYDLLGFLIPHETIRREAARGEEALRSFDCQSSPWKAAFFHEWIIDFFVPLLRTHHTIEDSITLPYYLSLNVLAPERQTEDHVELTNRENKLKSACAALVKACQTADMELVKEKESLVKVRYHELVDKMLEHFAEEEEFWPHLLRQCGPDNWAKVERNITDHTLQFGELNAGDPYRLLICAVSRAMGIQIGDDAFQAGETRWASEALQERYMASRPYAIRKTSVAWNQRYKAFRELIASVASGNTQELSVNKQGKVVDRLHKKPVPLLLFLTLCVFYCVSVTPYFAAVSNPLRNLKYLNIQVVNFDDGPVGAAFVDFFQTLQDNGQEQPNLRFFDATDYSSVDELQDGVLDGEAWAAVYVTANASQRLSAATANGCALAAGYHAQDAMAFAWDEGRNNIIAAPYIAGFLRTQLGRFGSSFAASYLAGLSSTTMTQCIANNFQRLLVNPVLYVEDNLTPVSVSYVAANAGLTVGNIFCAVFASTYVVNATFGGLGALSEDLTPLQRVLLKSVTMFALAFGLALCYATMMVGLTYNGSSGFLYDGSHWAQLLAINWVHMVIWSFGHAWELETLGPGLMPFFFGLFLTYSITSGWNTDLADPGYKHFFQIFPFHWAIYLQRYVFFGSQGFRRGIASGILIAYAAFFSGGFFYASLAKEERHLAIRHKIVFEHPLEHPCADQRKLTNADEDASSTGYQMVPVDEVKAVPVPVRVGEFVEDLDAKV